MILETIMLKTIFLKDISLSFSNKSCFEDFSSQVYPGSRIAIIGRNGSGKSSLLNILRGKLSPSGGDITIPDDVSIGYVEQTIHDFNDLSGGQRFNKRLSEALAQFPDLLLLDEPTNHLDKDNRKSLMQMLRRYQGTLIVVSHDTELLRNCIDTLWHIEPAYATNLPSCQSFGSARGFGGHGNNRIHEFTGSYDDYMREIKQKRASIEKELASLKRDKKDTHNALMKEQKRAAKSTAKGQKSIDQRKWPTVVSKAKALRAQATSGKKKSAIDKKKQKLTDQLSDLRLPEIILPKFSLMPESISSGNLLSISNASIGYATDTPIQFQDMDSETRIKEPQCTIVHEDSESPQDSKTHSLKGGGCKIILKNISLAVGGKERIAICGKNASGKSTLLKAILGKDEIFKTGDWYFRWKYTAQKSRVARSEASDVYYDTRATNDAANLDLSAVYIGYLDQHYSNLKPELSVIQHIQELRPDWTEIETRRHLGDFLFRKNEEVMQLCANLSGGEKARLSLGMIAAKTPRLLILDEITNNLDLETKEHVIQVLKAYPGAMIIVSHEEDFLEAIDIDRIYKIVDKRIIITDRL